MQTNVVIDLSNVTHILHHSILKKNSNIFSENYLIFNVIEYITQISKQYKADGVLVACDAPNVWRKAIYPEYKKSREANRGMYYGEVKECMKVIKDFFNNHTSIPALSVEKCEADDIIACVSRSKTNKTVIISSDTDFVQLLTGNVTLYSPPQKMERTTDDQAYSLFLKCIRGDSADNIPSSYPRVRETRLKQAWVDEYEMINLMETTNTNDVKVKDAYEFNKKLIDLSLQPNYIKTSIQNALDNLSINKYDSIGVMRFIGKHEMKEIASQFLRHKDVFKKGFIHDSR